ncbi:MAG: dienelactone hydrolase family protein [Thermodesulfobacteriota bacterium]
MRFAIAIISLLLILSSCLKSEAGSFRTWIPLPRGGSMPVYYFYPDYEIKSRLPAVIHGVGVGAMKIVQHHVHCQELANRGFVVMLVDPSNYPESLTPGPFEWERGVGYLVGSVNQGVVAARLVFDMEWYLDAIRAAVDNLWFNPKVDPYRIAISGYSQPANAALTYASRDPRIRAVVWNYGGSPWIMPYDVMRLPPVLIFHGTADDVYDVKYAKRLVQELAAAGKYFEAYIYPGQKHLFTIYFDITGEPRFARSVILETFERMVSFLNRVMPPGR